MSTPETTRALPRVLRRLLLALLAIVPIAAFGAPAMASEFAGSRPQISTFGDDVPYIVGGTETKASQAPWQIFLLEKTGEEEDGGEIEGLCGGSIISATEILTAAHCVDHENTSTPYPASDFQVLTGSSNMQPFLEEEKHSSTEQVIKVKSFRQDPYYNAEVHNDDVAVLTLEKAITLSAADNTAVMALAPAGSTPAPGTPLFTAGFGLQEGFALAPNGKLYSANMTAVSADACSELLGPVNSAIVFCAVSPTQSTCQGDSGSAIVTTSPLAQVGLTDYGPDGCNPGENQAFTNITAPEIRDFIEGNMAPPKAPRETSPPVLHGAGAFPVTFSPMTCEAGGWEPAPSAVNYIFQVGEAPNGAVLQSGPSNVFVPPATAAGDQITCIVNAANEGGTATARSGSSAPIIPDAEPPVASITAKSCTANACALQITASDPNALALSLEATAGFLKHEGCKAAGKGGGHKKAKKGKKGGPKKALASAAKKHKKKGKKKSGKGAKCSSVGVTEPMSVTPEPTPGVFSVLATKLPYGTPITFTVTAVNAAGVKQLTPLTESLTLAKPKGAGKGKHKGKGHKSKHKGKHHKSRHHKGKHKK